MNNQKIRGYISIANKAGYLIIGADKLKGYKKKLFLLLVDQAAGKNILKISESFENIEKITVDSLEELSQITNCKVLGIKNKGISDEILKIIRSENFGK